MATKPETVDAEALAEQFTQTGCEAAFTCLVEAQLPFVYSVAKRLVRDHHLAEDVSQQTFTALARTLQQGKPVRHVRAWLYETTRNHAISCVRSESRRRVRETKALLREMKDVDWMSDEDAQVAIDEAMTQLSSADRRALFLRFHEGHSFAELGQTLGIAERAAQKRVQRAVDRIRRSMKVTGYALIPGMLGAGLFVAHNSLPPAGLATTISSQALLAGPATSTVAGAPLLIKAGLGMLAAGLVAIPMVLHFTEGPSVASVGNGAVAAGVSLVPENREVTSERQSSFAIDDLETIYTLDDEPRTKALLALTEHLKGRDDGAYLGSIVERWSRLDPERASQTVLTLYRSRDEETQGVGDLFDTALMAWYAESPDKAMTWVATLERSDYAEAYAFEAMVTAMARQDLDKAYAWLARRPFNRSRAYDRLAEEAMQGRSASQVLDWLAQLPEDPAVSLESAVGSVSPYHQEAGATKTGIWLALVEPLFARGVGALADRLTTLPGSPRATRIIARFVERWAEEAPEKAVGWIDQLPDVDRTAAAEALASVWALSDVSASQRWIASLSPEMVWPVREAALQARVEGSAPVDWRAELGSWQNDTAANGVFRMAADKLEGGEVLRWVGEMSEDQPHRATLIDHGAYKLGQTQGREGLASLNGLRDRERSQALHAFSLGWIVRDRPGFSAWRKTLSQESEDFYRVTAAETDLLAAVNPEAAARRVLDLPETALRDLPMMVLLERSMHRSLESNGQATVWAEAIVDEAQRASMESRIAEARESLENGAEASGRLPSRKVVDFKSQSLSDLRERLDLMSH